MACAFTHDIFEMIEMIVEVSTPCLKRVSMRYREGLAIADPRVGKGVNPSTLSFPITASDERDLHGLMGDVPCIFR